MLTLEQLCRHLCYCIHTPIRIFDKQGDPISYEVAGDNQEDPLICDPTFTADLMALRTEDMPVLHYEAFSVLYAVIPEENGQTILLGPICYERGSEKASAAVAVLHGLKHPNAYHINYLPLDIALEAILMLFHVGSDRVLSRDELIMQNAITDYSVEAEANAYAIVYHLRENNSSHNSYAQEAREQKAIREGNLTALRNSWDEAQTGQIGRLARDDVSHIRSLAIVVITLSSRSAIEGGVLPEIAYSLADSFTMKANELTDSIELVHLFRSAEIRYTELVQAAAQKNIQSRHVIRCKELIHDRLHQRVRASDLADELGLTRSYLSKIFLQEEGVRLSSYILTEKLRASEFLLMTPEISLEQIAATFGFASQSHYGQAFKKYRGVTPGTFRESHQNRH